jgi:hypothetical protein
VGCTNHLEVGFVDLHWRWLNGIEGSNIALEVCRYQINVVPFVYFGAIPCLLIVGCLLV